MTGGAFAFGVGVDPGDIRAVTVDVPETPGPSPLEVAGRIGLYVGLALLAGTAWVGFLVPPSRRLLAGGWIVAAAGLVSLALAQRSAAGVSFVRLASSPIGRALAWRGALLLAAAAAVLAVVRTGGRARTVALGSLGAAAAGAMLAHVAAGHAATGDLGWAKVIVQWVHFGGIAVWIGGLAVLLAGLRGLPAGARAAAVRRFSSVAAFALAVIAGSGISRAVNEVGGWGRLVSTSYGRVVTAKVTLFAVLALLGALNRYRAVPAAEGDTRLLRRVSRIELGAAAVVLVLTGLLASLVPARNEVLAEPVGSLVVSGTDFARTVSVELEVTPGFAGFNTFEVRLESSNGHVDADRVSLRFVPAPGLGVQPSALELDEEGGGVWRAEGANLSVDGRWDVVVLVGRGARSTEVELALRTRCRADALATPGQPTLHTAGLGAGREVQAYADPGEPGFNEVHFTFFDPSGNELPVGADVAITAFPEGGDAVALEVRRFGPGHLVGDAELDAGVWVFDVLAESEPGDRLTACFEELIGS
jgi:copper transport protein